MKNETFTQYAMLGPEQLAEIYKLTCQDIEQREVELGWLNENKQALIILLGGTAYEGVLDEH